MSALRRKGCERSKTRGAANRVSPLPSRAFAMPLPETLRFVCGNCDTILTSSLENVGRFLDCPKCKTRLRVPEPDEAQRQVEAARHGKPLRTREEADEALRAAAAKGRRRWPA